MIEAAIAGTGMNIIGSGLGYRGRQKALEAQQAALDAENRRQRALQAKADAILQEVFNQAGWDDTQRAVDQERNTILAGSQRVAGATGAGAAQAAASVAPGAARVGRVRAAGLGTRRAGNQASMVARIKAELVRQQLLNELLGQADVDRQGLVAASDRSMRAYRAEADAAAMQGIGERTLGDLIAGGGSVVRSLGGVFG